MSQLKIYLVEKNPYSRENFQRNCILRGLKNAKEDDLILISDLDEIPNPNVFSDFKINMKFAVFKQMHFYYKFNLHSVSLPFWYGSRICVFKYLKSPQWLRDLKFKKRPWWRFDKYRLNNIIENGGWHFCNLKKPNELIYKYKNLCETDDPFVFKEKINQKFLDKKEINKKINYGLDIIGRNHKYKPIKISNKFPKYLVENLNKFKDDWII
jgi:beta-1,4-mannosyl-glycoprotein beta-1,4-N-acetylglucosaminyltransferase